MNNVIIGTAGHIDHGKTTLIKALSGIETDTTLEEKERGMSINLGFAYFDLPSGKRCGVVDVPGHEKFIKNMLAGVSGINLVLLLVDVREGIMPQTREHIDILSLLGIENYIVVVTKIDLVDDEYRELVVEDIKEFIKGTSLENSPIIEVDSISKKGIPKLLETIDTKTEDIAKIKESKNARLNIDRSFQVRGFGTVVTGTLLEGTISVGDELAIYPHNKRTKVRSIQVHSEDVQTAFAGQRTAINLSNIKFEDTRRGYTLATPDTLTKTYMVDTEISIINNSEYNLELWDRVRVYIGTTEVMARVVPLGIDTLEAGDKGFVQLRLEEEIAVKNYDKFIIRTYSPMITIGGGVILDVNPNKHSRFNEEVLSKLKIQSEGNIQDLIANYLLSSHSYLADMEDISKNLEQSEEAVAKELSNLLSAGSVYKIDNQYIHSKKYDDIKEKMLNVVEDYHKKFKLKIGIPKVELLSKFKINSKDIALLIELLIINKELKITNNFVSLWNFEVKYDSKQLMEKNRIEKQLLSAKFTPPSIKDLTKGVRAINEVLDSLIGNSIVKLDEDLVLHMDIYNDAVTKVTNHFEKEEQMTLAEFRDMTGSSRRYSMAILEYMDKQGITRRVENYRVLNK
ncbi:selenocysteine-specific translation elongation factor [Gemella sp. GH3]|uniref:selenocysteine-specific translation elongation factor n=1 Tax=unclassified Gemella TaxID=2624949 RepID=UPI0015D05FBB|nr:MULTISPECIES: selenocysteine-specific translation elongation factor [unclassified Gemella]MBF0713343.1 selenocysteine-specific translation elongation factor [Gemella sp. GH3.1]NYS50295.1 selenocysteine-specific translation elongation factor [Gemella sp. GH3]